MIGLVGSLAVAWTLVVQPGEPSKDQPRRCGEICELKASFPLKAPPAQSRLPFNPMASYFRYLDCTMADVRSSQPSVLEDARTMDAFLQSVFDRCSEQRKAGDSDLRKKIRGIPHFATKDYPVADFVRFVRSLAVFTSLGDHYKQAGFEDSYVRYVLGVVPQLTPKSGSDAQD
jgi:hypothetical protein